jgi:hypothetical protein
MKKLFSYWRFLSLAVLFVYACNNKKEEVSVVEPNIDYAKVSSLLSGAFSEVDAYKASNPYDVKKIGDLVNAYSEKQTGTTAFQVEEIERLLQKYEKYRQVDNPSIQPLINALMNDKLLTGVQGALLSDLDGQMLKTTDVTTCLRILDDFEYKVMNNAQLNSIEKTVLRLFKTGVKTGFEYLQGTEMSRSDCTDCIVRRKWQIFGWACLVVVVGLVACILATGGFGAPACILGIALGWAGVIKATCPYCFRI